VVFGPRASAGLHATLVVRTVSLALRYALLMAAGAVPGRIVA
jgi:hypothetical protein